jgi:23S rRNA pseudouridine2605 synthase
MRSGPEDHRRRRDLLEAAAEELILAGSAGQRPGRPAQLGTKADPERDEIRVEAGLITTEVERVYLMLNNPPVT